MQRGRLSIFVRRSSVTAFLHGSDVNLIAVMRALALLVVISGASSRCRSSTSPSSVGIVRVLLRHLCATEVLCPPCSVECLRTAFLVLYVVMEVKLNRNSGAALP